jgi:drug/metabolite transporter (DMT)-like permease
MFLSNTTPISTRVEVANLLLLPTSALTIPITLPISNTISNSNNITDSNINSNSTPGIFTATAIHDQQQQQQQYQQQQRPPDEAVVVLQARMETCHELIAAATAAAISNSTTTGLHAPYAQSVDSSIIHSNYPNNNNNNNSAHELQQQQQQQQSHILSPITQIQGVVDLDALSAITGVSRSDFHTDWRPPPPPTQTSVDSGGGGGGEDLESSNDTTAPPPPPDIPRNGSDVDDENDIVELNHHHHHHHHEGTPLLSPSPVSSASYQTEILPYTLSPVYNHNHMNKINQQNDHVVLDTVLLKADAFVETLTDVLDGYTNHTDFQHRYPHRDTNVDDDNDDDNDIESMTQDDFDGDVGTNYDDVSGVTPGGAFFVPRPENLGANLRSNRQHAFLLEIPSLPPHYPTHNNNYHSTNSMSSDVPSHFILAIPKQDGTGLWQDDVSDASNDNNDNDSFLLGLSHLPTDVCDVQIEAIQYNDTETIRLDVVVKRQVPVIGYILLIGGLLALSSVGTALNVQQNVSPIMKSFWRYTSTWIVLLPLTIRSLQHSHNGSGYIILSPVQWICFFVCALCYAFMTSAFVSALAYTTLANAFVLSNLAPLFIIVGRTVLGYSVLYMEGIGAMIGFMGGTICTLDQTPTVNGDGIVKDHPKALFGDCLAVMASAAVAIYLLMAKKLRPHIELFVFTFLLMFTSSIIVLIYMILTKEPMSFSNHIDYGLWGWTNWQWNRLPLELYLAIVCNIMGTTGYIAVMKYFEPIVVSTVMLSEPVLGALMAALVGSDPLPGLQTWIGNLVVAFGIFLVVWSGARSTETIDATKALLQVNNNSDNLNSNSYPNNAITSTPYHQGNHHNTSTSNKSTTGVPLLKNHPVKAAMNSPHRILPNIRMRSESMC